MEKKITLVVVDFQYDFCLRGAPLYVPGSDRALWNISHLIENKKIGEVIFTADWHPANHCSFKRNGGEWNEVEAIGWIPLDSIDKYQWAFDHDKIIREFAEWMHLEDGDLDMEDIDLDPV